MKVYMKWFADAVGVPVKTIKGNSTEGKFILNELSPPQTRDDSEQKQYVWWIRWEWPETHNSVVVSQNSCAGSGKGGSPKFRRYGQSASFQLLLIPLFFFFYLWVLHPVAYLSDSLWHRQSQQSFNTLTPFNFLFYSLHYYHCDL
jgi:hypothetical protein